MKTVSDSKPTLKTLAESVTMTSEYGARLPWDKQDEWQQKANGWRCTLRYQGRRFTLDFWQGVAITDAPTANGVLECLMSVASLADSNSFEEFCSELGYDTDSRKAERSYKSTVRQTEHVKRLLGADFETFLYAERD